MKTILLPLLCIFVLLSCKIGMHTLSDKQLDDHYKNRKTRPSLKYLKYKDFHIHHALVGDTNKPLLLYVHGAPGAWYSSMNLMDDSALQKNFRMIAVDRVGFGKSQNGRSITSIDQHVRYLERLVLEYNQMDRKIYLLGSSYGAPIAALFAMHNPSIVDELFLVSPVLDPSTEKIFWFTWVARLAFINMWLSPEWQVATNEKFAHRNELRKMKINWKRITSKTTVIMGEKDWIADTANLSFAKRMLVNARDPRFYLLPDVGHGIIWNRTNIVKDLLLNREIADKFSYRK